MTAGECRSSPAPFFFCLLSSLFSSNTTASFSFFPFAFFVYKENLNPSLFFSSHGALVGVLRLSASCEGSQSRTSCEGVLETTVCSLLLLLPSSLVVAFQSCNRIGPPLSPLPFPPPPPLSLRTPLNSTLQALPGQVTPEGVPSFKLVLVGDGGTGKWAVLREEEWRKKEEEEEKGIDASSALAFLVSLLLGCLLSFEEGAGGGCPGPQR